MGRDLREILLVGGDREINEPLREELSARAYAVSVARQQEEGLRKALNPAVAVVVSQLADPLVSGLDLLRELHPARPALPIILVDREVRMRSAIEAAKLGA